MFNTTALPATTLRKLLIAASCLLWSFNSHAIADLNEVPSGDYALDLTHASIVWKVSHFGMSNYVARFTDFDAHLTLDSENFAKSSVTAVIQSQSVSTEYPYAEKKDFNKKLAEGKDWFNSNAFPTITFQSTRLIPIDKTSSKLEGELTFLGISKPITLDLTLNGTMESHPFKGVPAIGFSAKTTIQRKDWGLIKYLPSIGNEVKIEIEGEFLAKE